MQELQQNIVNILAYFDIFQYPLTHDDIRNFITVRYSRAVIDEQLQALTRQKIIYKLDEFYALENNIRLAERRRSGNKKAIAEFRRAATAARILFKFPFVDGLAISGSLSKNFADDSSDIDFFIITRPGRLWIARTLMHLFYKLAALAGRQRMFCMNYYIDGDALEIPEQNIFTAMEIATLVPMQGGDCVHKFIAVNVWLKKYFPVAALKVMNTAPAKKGVVRKFSEWLLGGRLGNSIDNGLYKLTERHWQKKEHLDKTNAKGISMGMLAGKHFAKPDPKNLQDKILTQYENKTRLFADRLLKNKAVLPEIISSGEK